MPDAYLPILLFVGAILVGGVGMWVGHLHAKKRREALAALAAELGLTFTPHRDGSHSDLYGHFGVFNRGHSRAAYNTMQGVVEVDDRPYALRLGDYTYKVTSGSGKNRRTTTYRLSYFIVALPFAQSETLRLRREHWGDKIASAFGADDIDFESEAFSRRFHVSSNDKRFAYDVFHPRMIEFLMQTEAPDIEMEMGRCLFTDGRRTWTPEQFRARLAWVKGFFDRWPDHLTRELDERSGRATTGRGVFG